MDVQGLWLLWLSDDDGFRAFAQAVVEETVDRMEQINKG